MNSIYIQELKPYSRLQILSKIGEKSFKSLLNHSIIQRDDDTYLFRYVGVILTDSTVINCYPKYFPESDKKEFKEIIKSIKKYRRLNEEIDYQNDELEDISFNLLSMMVFFVEDYFENGLYSNTQNILEINGSGEIDWERTINTTDPVISSKKPYYIELQTKYKINDLFDYFRLLHEYIITESSKRLEKAGLLEMFDLTPAELSSKSRDDFGDADIILENLEKQLNVEFATRKIKLLKSMHAFIKEENSFSNENYLTVFGTDSYHVIWEDICRRVFDSRLDKPLHQIVESESSAKLIDVIKKPRWILDAKEFKTDTFRPDLITFFKDYFIILDAKYYKLKITSKLEKQPGLSDVTKQYLYQLAYMDFIEKYKFRGVKNAFLMPKFDGEIENKGYAEIEILHDLGLENIQVIMLPAGLMIRYYLDNRKMSIGELDL